MNNVTTENTRVLVPRRLLVLYLTAVLGTFAAVMFWYSSLLTFGDEYVFYRMANDLTHMTDRIVWFYGPLVPVLVWPIVKLSGGTSMISHHTMMALRVLPITLTLLSLLMVFDISRRRVGTAPAMFFAVPPVLAGRLFVGAMWFYWDPFLMFFFVLALYTLGRAPLWVSLALGTLLVNAKTVIGPMFLVPLLFKDRRFAWCLLSYAPWMLGMWLIAGDPLHMLNYYRGAWFVDFHAVPWFLENMRADLVLYLVATLPCLWLIRRHPTEIAFYVATLLYSIGAGLGVSHTSTIIFSGALVFPLIADRGMKFPKEVKADGLR